MRAPATLRARVPCRDRMRDVTPQGHSSGADDYEMHAAVHAVPLPIQPSEAMSRTRRRTSTETKVVESFPALGAAIGLLTADPGVARPCRGTASACVSDSLGASLAPYISGALAGAAVGLAVGLAL